MIMSKTKYNTNILSWNIQSTNTIIGSKFDDPEFCKILLQHEIICLQEVRQCVKLPGYRAYNNTHDHGKHGGVSILVKNDISDGICMIKTPVPDIVVCKMKQSFFNLSSDTYIVNVYAKPANTSSATSVTSGIDTLHELDSLINDLLSRGEVVLCGDFNARISNELDFIIDDEDSTDSYLPLPIDYVPDNVPKRNSQDQRVNSYKRPFLELLTNNGIHILNGRTLGDFAGKFTCVQLTGSSVVDYFVASPKTRHLVNHLTVMPFTIFSDHKPLSLSIRFNCILTKRSELSDEFSKAPIRYKFCEKNKEAYIAIQSVQDMTNIVNEISTKTYNNNSDGTYKLNRDLTKYLQTIADKTLTKTKHTSNKSVNKKPWFNIKCREGKRLTQKAARILSDFPDSDYLRQNYYKVKKQYKVILKSNKSCYFDNLNADIENGKVLNWKQFKRLKQNKSTTEHFDSLDMRNFEIFFKNLYSNNHSTISTLDRQKLLQEADRVNTEVTNAHIDCSSDSPFNILNHEISHAEIITSIKSLKNGKSSSDDLICNEMLKNLSDNGIKILHKLFNKCLETGSYPWNNSIISPLHKKGNKENPDNYRAIAISSTIGKLFSTLLLERLIKFRNVNCPDPSNQLGFTKGAQTYDHVLTLHTITSKYRKLRKKVYAVFVDFRKAFDSVCREALFYKLSNLGISGNFYNVLRHMYSHSTAQIKLSNHISNKIPINKGTEQGHPLSPDLFKIFISDLSPLLEQASCPELMGKIVSHLLWADDLILLALDPITLQTQLNILDSFCKQWGIDINIGKTKSMIFNGHNKESYNFYLGNKTIDLVDTYCYLGFNIHNSGSFTHARHALRLKAMRSLYGLKNTINKTKLSHRSLCTLFDTLIKPIMLYGAPIWCPSMSIINSLGKLLSVNGGNLNNIATDLPRKISLLNCEKVHLHFLKWSLGVHRRSSNIGSWGETGRYPLIYECINLTLKYIKRLNSCGENTLVGLAYKEQQASNLDWYRNIEPILEIDSSYTTDRVTLYKNNAKHSSHNCTSDQIENTASTMQSFITYKGTKKYLSHCQNIKSTISQQFTPHIITKSLKIHFKTIWQCAKSSSPKLEFYNHIKSDFDKEPYLEHVNNFYDRANLTKLRISAHELQIESGRYKNISRENRLCKWCRISTGSEMVESEDHVLYDCDLYSIVRQQHLQTISDLVGVPLTGVNFMSLLRPDLNDTSHTLNHFDRDHPDDTASTLPSTTLVTREIARFVTHIFKLAKNISVSSAPPISVFPCISVQH